MVLSAMEKNEVRKTGIEGHLGIIILKKLVTERSQ